MAGERADRAELVDVGMARAPVDLNAGVGDNLEHSGCRSVARNLRPRRRRAFRCGNGAGLDADALSRIFTFDAESKSGGQDLDLHASANAAKSIGGSLSAASDGPGKGSSFVLELPKGEGIDDFF